MQSEKIRKLKNMLDVAAKQGVKIYQGERLATPDDIVRIQCVCEDYNYVPDFIVKDSTGEIKEIWYSGKIAESHI